LETYNVSLLPSVPTEKALKVWRAAVMEILTCTGIKPAHISDALKWNRSLLHRFLDGTRNPSTEKIAQINCAIGAELKYPVVTEYLSFVLASEMPAKEGAVPERFYAESLGLFGPYVPPDRHDAMMVALRSLDDGAARKLAAGFLSIVRREMLWMFAGETHRDRLNVRITALFRRFGLPVDEWLGRNDDFKAGAERASWALVETVRTALVSATTDVSLRVRLESEIVMASVRFMGSALEDFEAVKNAEAVAEREAMAKQFEAILTEGLATQREIILDNIVEQFAS
jgi:hypothetical protein